VGIFPTWHNLAYHLFSSQGGRKMESFSWRQQRNLNNLWSCLLYGPQAFLILCHFTYASFLCGAISPLPLCSNSAFPYDLVQSHDILLDFFQLVGWTYFLLWIWWHTVLYNRGLGKHGNQDWFWSQAHLGLNCASLIWLPVVWLQIRSPSSPDSAADKATNG